MVLAEGARLGPFSIYRDLVEILVGEHSDIGSWNWVTCAPNLVTALNSDGYLRIGNHSAITSRHYLDCSGGIAIGDYVTVAGVRSTFITHQISIERNEQTVAAISVGDYALLGSNVSIVPGARVPDRSLVAMGSVVARGLEEANSLYAGVPARRVRAIEGAYFTRSDGSVSPPKSLEGIPSE